MFLSSSLVEVREECELLNGPDWVDLEILGLSRSVDNAQYLPYEVIEVSKPLEESVGYFVDYDTDVNDVNGNSEDDYFWDGYQVYPTYKDAFKTACKFYEGHSEDKLHYVGRYVTYALTRVKW